MCRCDCADPSPKRGLHIVVDNYWELLVDDQRVVHLHPVESVAFEGQQGFEGSVKT